MRDVELGAFGGQTRLGFVDFRIVLRGELDAAPVDGGTAQ